MSLREKIENPYNKAVLVDIARLIYQLPSQEEARYITRLGLLDRQGAFNEGVEACPKAVKLELLTDEEFLKWCGTHKVKGCGQWRIMKSKGKSVREVWSCEDCRVKAQLAKIKRDNGLEAQDD